MSVLDKDFLTLKSTSRAPRSSWSAEGSALVADALRRSGRLRQGVRLRVHGESMLPAVWPGDVVEIASCSLEDVRPGEIVLALRDGRLFLHRFVALCAPNGFLLRGDSMPGSDPQFPPEALLGRLVRSADQGRAVSAPALRLGFGAKWFGVKWSRALGMLLCHCGLARRFALKLHRRRKTSVGEFRNPEQAADMSSAELGAL
ncbi:MAG TPA: S24/S26 family peptidase [Terriglobales bacterium]|nr:S24/S26 family peptidase [Terriglobales bacterium]